MKIKILYKIIIQIKNSKLNKVHFNKKYIQNNKFNPLWLYKTFIEIIWKIESLKIFLNH